MDDAGAVAVIDIGKTNARVVLFDCAGRELGMRTAASASRTDGPYPHLDTARIWEFICDALNELNRTEPVDGIAVTTHGAAGAFLYATAGDDGGEGLALPILDYEFDGPDELSDEYQAIRPRFAETLSPRLPGGLNLGAQIYWQTKRFPEAVADALYVTYPQYWAWRLAGVAATEGCFLGSHTDLWNPRLSTWSSLVTRAGWEWLFAPVRRASDRLGPVRPDLGARLGLAPETPVVCGIHDSNASLLPHLLQREPPFAVASTGTWVVVFAVGGSLDRLDPERDTLASVTAVGGPVPCARFMGGREFELLTAGAAQEPDAAAVDRVVRGLVMALPPLVPGVGPFPGGTGGWADPAAALDPQERTAAASLYLALVTAESMALADAAGPTIVEGPFARNLLFCAALAAIAGRPVIPSSSTGGTSRGAAMLFGPRHFPPAAEDEPVAPLDHPAFADYVRAWRARVATGVRSPRR